MHKFQRHFRNDTLQVAEPVSNYELKLTPSVAFNMSYPKKVGFIGLGVMGYPMVQNLATKLPQSTHIYVFDVATQVMENLITEYPGKITACQSSKEITSKCVCWSRPRN